MKSYIYCRKVIVEKYTSVRMFRKFWL